MRICGGHDISSIVVLLAAPPHVASNNHNGRNIRAPEILVSSQDARQAGYYAALNMGHDEASPEPEEDVEPEADEQLRAPADEQLRALRAVEQRVLGHIARHKEQWEGLHPGENFDAVRPGTLGRSPQGNLERTPALGGCLRQAAT